MPPAPVAESIGVFAPTPGRFAPARGEVGVETCAILPSMKELSADERLRRLIGAADRECEGASLADAERGDALYRACRGAFQILDARPDGESVRFRQEPPAPDYPRIWTRLNRRWRERRKT